MFVGAVLESPNDGAGVLAVGAADAVALPNVNPPAEALVTVGAAVDFERSPNPFVDVTDVGALEDELNKPPPADALLLKPDKLIGAELVIVVADDELVVEVSVLLSVPKENNPDEGAEFFVSTVLEAALLPDVILPKL